MLIVKHPTYQFWLTVYMFPAMVPLVMNFLFDWVVADQLKQALGDPGIALCSKITLALLWSALVLVALAHFGAWRHARSGKPALPNGSLPPPGLWRGAGRAIGYVFGTNRPTDIPRPPGTN